MKVAPVKMKGLPLREVTAVSLNIFYLQSSNMYRSTNGTSRDGRSTTRGRGNAVRREGARKPDFNLRLMSACPYIQYLIGECRAGSRVWSLYSNCSHPSRWRARTTHYTTAPERSYRTVTKYCLVILSAVTTLFFTRTTVFHMDLILLFLETFLWYGLVGRTCVCAHHGRRRRFAWRHSHSQRDI